MVGLTSLDFDYHALGRDTARLAVDLIEGSEAPRESTGYALELHVRRSSGLAE